MGRDRAGDNLGIYADGGSYCFQCGFRTGATLRAKLVKEFSNDATKDAKENLLPADFTREVPAAAWKWLLQYGLPYSYWKTYCGYSEKEGRLVFPIGHPTRFSIGRALNPVGTSKWKVYGDKSSYVETIGEQVSGKVVLVEDLISAHKVAASGYLAIPLFGTSVHENVLKRLIALGKPVVLWLDQDQYAALPKKLGRIKALTGLDAVSVTTRLDPKEQSANEIKEILC